MLHWKLICHGNQWYENNYYNNQNLYKNKTKEVLIANVKFKIEAIFFPFTSAGTCIFALKQSKISLYYRNVDAELFKE